MESNNQETLAQEPQEQDAKKKKKKGFWRECREWATSLIAAVAIVLICQNFLFTLIRVDGSSMNPTLVNGERLFVTVADVKFGGDVPRDTVVICRYPNRKEFFVKRVVAVPGDSVCRVNGATFVLQSDGKEVVLDPEYALHYLPSPDYAPYTLGEDEYFVVGDNRYNSHDSRDWNDLDDSMDVGPITKDMIVGRVRQVIWPLSQIRAVE